MIALSVTFIFKANSAQESFNSRLKAEGDDQSTNLYISNLPKTLTEVVRYGLTSKIAQLLMCIRNLALFSSVILFYPAKSSVTAWATAEVLALLGLLKSPDHCRMS